MKRGNLIVKVDDEYNAEEFFALLTDELPEVAESIRKTGTAEVEPGEWEDIQRLSGFYSDMPHAPTALVVVE